MKQKTFCGKPIPLVLNPEGFPRFCNNSHQGMQCPECAARDKVSSTDPTPFEVINAHNMPFIRHKDMLINVNRITTFELFGSVIQLNDNELEMCFNDEAEAEACFYKIMGGKSAKPTSRELKQNKTRHHALQEQDAENV